MAKGIIDATGDQCFITYHPWGGQNSTSQWIQNESWLDMNMFQSGHGGGHDVAFWDLVKRDRRYKPRKPTLDAEPNSEDHPVNPWPKWNPDNGYYRDYDVRKQTYRSVFAGACWVTYGHHAVWQFMSAREEVVNYPDGGWIKAMDRAGAYQVGYLKRLITSKPMLTRIPDSIIVAKGQGKKGEYIEAFRTADNNYAMFYLPVGKTITINAACMSCPEIVSWRFNPKNAEIHKGVKTMRKDRMDFTSPTIGIGNDRVLIIDDATKHYKEPGLLE